jgi:hypothetical protein
LSLPTGALVKVQEALPAGSEAVHIRLLPMVNTIVPPEGVAPVDRTLAR